MVGQAIPPAGPGYSDPAAKPVDLPAIALGWLAIPHCFEMRHQFAFFRQL
jgi:hypothetical protein